MTKDYLLEIGLEEVPARFLKDLSDQLRIRVSDFLTDERLTFSSIEPYATPRRLAVIVRGLSEAQADIEEKAKGPSLKIAQDESGNWTKAAQGFARGQGGTPEDLIVEEVKGEDYVFIQKSIKGKPASEVLQGIVTVVKSMIFPVSMTWHDYQTPYIRPIHWFVSLLDDEVIPFEFVEVKSGRQTRGHRFLGESVDIASVDSYVEQLRDEFVIANYEERQAIIREQIEKIATENNWNIPIDEDLLDEVTSIVEWPTAFSADFEEEYLAIPKRILVTAMRDHQRYFYVENPENEELLPYFVSVRNGDSNHIENVARGNQKVLRARLEDALFFYENDTQQTIDSFVEKLANVNEHYKLGTLTDKQNRVQQMIPVLTDAAQLDASVSQTAQEAASIYKFDLMTGIVDEFAELQGYMGGYYAKHFGLSEEVANAVATQYLPVTSGGALPDTQAGAILAIADKLDTLVGYFSVGMQPTGSNDPYALRRQATGILEIILDQNWHIDLESIIHTLVSDRSQEAENVTNDLVEFIKNRLEPHLSKSGVDYDIINAVKEANGLDLVYNVNSAIQLHAMKKVQASDYREMMEAITRVTNLGSKGETEASMDEALAESNSERQLISVINDLPRQETDPQVQLENFNLLINPINNYFENNMVNADDEKIKNNRYATMQTLTNYINIMLDPREIITKF
ncbi:glycine--tRNA ligase subunit beta [Aerococcaceae bacterium DSM 111176]|nr:glycine--tRNA ligase subunit beta [Aerococcaceae bacterium DSM 111176]